MMKRKCGIHACTRLSPYAPHGCLCVHVGPCCPLPYISLRTPPNCHGRLSANVDVLVENFRPGVMEVG